ncbi:MAG TPA: hypothetical protein DHN33_05610 [Eubacteriaceae bacterium]|nr:hypothetical protein [Eubacteriaceae bacterium]
MEDQQGRVPYEYALKEFLKQEIGEVCERLNVRYDPEKKALKLKMMGQKYYIHEKTGEVKNEQDELISSYILRILILRYLVHGSGEKATGKMISYKEIPDGPIYYPNFKSRTIDALAQAFDQDKHLFQRANDRLNHLLTDNGDGSIEFEFINDVFMVFVAWESDEEFEASANILFSSNTPGYFNAEDLAVVGDVALSYFKNGGLLKEDIGMY